MATGALQEDMALVMFTAAAVPPTASAKDNHKAAEIRGWIRQHSRSMNLLGGKQTRVGGSKMDCDAEGYKQEG